MLISSKDRRFLLGNPKLLAKEFEISIKLPKNASYIHVYLSLFASGHLWVIKLCKAVFFLLEPKFPIELLDITMQGLR